jgi:hypothetical protein
MKAHNVYIEENAWKAAKKQSLNHSELLKKEIIKKPDGTSSAYSAMATKVLLLLDYPGLVNDKTINFKNAIEYCKKRNLPLSKYVSTLT